MIKTHPQEKPNNAVVSLNDFGIPVIEYLDGVEVVQCTHCPNVRPVTSFKNNEAIEEWQNTCVSNPRNN